MAYTGSKSMSGRASQLLIGAQTGAGGTEVFTIIGEVSKASLSALELAIVEVSNFQSGVYEEKQGTMINPGTVSITYNYIAGASDPGQQALIAAQLTTNPFDFKLALPLNTKITPPQATTGDTFAFSALVSKVGELSIDTKDTIKGTAELTITGARPLTPGV